MSLPAIDATYLRDRGIDHSVSSEANMICVVINNYQLPAGYDRTHSSLLLRLNPGYPDVPPDMWWFAPPIGRSDGQEIPATQVRETHLGRNWQRWSRHLNAGQWRSGIDCLETLLALVRKELERCAMQVAA